ncbi:MAG: 4Fe-4S ferredoxin [Spirochaetes bacterium GWF1_41_5]|nr:MAG: 4Fe-4S ferredoxin [Spirochaetes bacterium GWF1_41_5]HBE03910.1 4Fe-4S ferredoxin [Spirochaetia bacterium]
MSNFHECGCPGSQIIDRREEDGSDAPSDSVPSELKQWPIQMHLVSPGAPYFKNADIVISADCVAYALGNFHGKYLRGKSLAIACPKLDDGQDVYAEKIKALIDESKANTITVLIMQVPCCGGLLRLVKEAAAGASRKIPIKAITVSLQGEILSEDWVAA